MYIIMKHYKLIIIFFAIFFSTSCKKDYLETFPTTAVSAADAVASTQNAWAALNGIHRVMYTQYDVQGQAGEGSINIFRDLLGEDIVYPLASGSTGLAGWLRWTIHVNANAADLRFVYRFYYRLIGNANVLINGIDNATGPEADKRFIKGQALAYRGWAHFQLVQLWGKRYDAGAVPNNQPGIPIMITNTLEAQPQCYS
jgi:starch-binding outer membrane protein, SusD/RagB family